MDTIIRLHLCKLFFATITFFMVVVGVLINIFEPYIPVLITRTYKYGKFASKEECNLVKKLEIPKSSFKHFYVASAVISPIIFHEAISVYFLNRNASQWIIKLLNFSCGPDRKTTVSAIQVFIAVILILLQIYRRLYDTCFVSVFSTKATINLTHYLIGMAYYPAILLVILSEAPKFSNNIMTSFYDSNIRLRDIGVIDIFAIILFLWAWYHQHVTTVILANIRKNKKGDVVNQVYEIPKGDWFNYLSSPHQTAEILMYTAVTLLLFTNTAWWYVYVWVLANQMETMLLSHWWYQNHFENFPKQRKAIIPFIY